MKLTIAILITFLVTFLATAGSLFAMTETKVPDIKAFTRGVERMTYFQRLLTNISTDGETIILLLTFNLKKLWDF